MYLFVYGSLKLGGYNHSFLEDSKFICFYKLQNHCLVDVGHGFPYLVTKNNSFVYGEVWQVDSDTITITDRLEGVPNLFTRQVEEISEPYNQVIGDLNYYLSRFDLASIDDEIEFCILDNNYFPVDNEKVLFNVVVDDRKYTDEAKKIVFHMRFFDMDRTKTNYEYMELVKARSHLDLNTSSEALFLRDCIIRGIVSQFAKPQINELIVVV